ncbi:MAG TPA: peptidase domain-containing ABC transporter [Herpetosiphon sp.]|uniref:ABC transporter related n=1 Tax=Herpetosiphon aurantiacus (strain ATCC 23779 / DSM 785 / 114-95) TaxID=316274 RepID=A9AUI5_HERA2|nr:peptidase domain-containing ABC transporter [Herpetosiphon sp.]ABX04512.1 ABC transporter related [Herpetosiphon aurantiacus DSM 785]HBW49889.1 peptidase domain-containing ABC transporter [Herpetosiphon sp.]
MIFTKPNTNQLLKRYTQRRKVPVLLQMSQIECGAACLAMILTYYGYEMSVAECRERCGVGRDGISAKTLAQAARSYQLEVKAFSFTYESLLALRQPIIIHWNFNHFVVLERTTETYAEIIDPNFGRRRIDKAEFLTAFTGVSLVMQPSASFQRRKIRRETILQNYIQLLTQHKTLFFQLIFTSILLQLGGLVVPLFTKIVIDTVIPQALIHGMTLIALAIMVFIAMQGVIQLLRQQLTIYLQTKLDLQIMQRFFRHLLALPFVFFEQRSSGDLLMRLNSNTIMRELITSQVLTLILDGSLVLGYFLLIWWQSNVLAAIVLGFALLEIGLVLLAQSRLREIINQDLDAQAKAQGFLVEALNGMTTIKASGIEQQVYEQWSPRYTNQLVWSLRRSRASAVIDTAINCIHMSAVLGLLWFGTQLVLNQQLSTGSLLALLGIAGAFFAPLAMLIRTVQNIQLANLYFQRIADVLHSNVEQPNKPTPSALMSAGQIELRDVSFRYSTHSPIVLKNIQLTIKPGQKVALVGKTGSGKSTLAKLLLGMYQPSSGAIYYDKQPTEAFDLATLRQQFGVVLQDTFLFSGSIRQNITLQRHDLKLAQVIEACQQAAIASDIEAMPMGLETILAEGGSSLSGGQRQRLALARALVHQPSVLLLDEATSHLDVATEAEVDRNLNHLACTRIVIAHRLSTIVNADLIVVLRDGQIIEQGRHEELLAQAGYYAQLIQQQA